MNTIKKGDTVKCVSENGWLLIDHKPLLGKDYKVLDVDGNYLVLEGFSHKPESGIMRVDLWHSKNFEKVKTLTQILAEAFLGSLTEERSEYERVFTLSASF